MRGMYEGKHIHYSELDHKPLCSYSPKLCKQRRLNGYAFCIRHVLEDRSAPFRQCEYVAKYNSQRCTNPIPNAEDRRYCNSHLQVLGVLPKKERKKRHDSLESLALNITVPSLALKSANGLDHLPPSPPSSLPSLLSLDPFGLCGGEGVAHMETLLQRKPSQGRQTSSNAKQKPPREPESRETPPTNTPGCSNTTGHPPQQKNPQQKTPTVVSAMSANSMSGPQQGTAKPPPTKTLSSSASNQKRETPGSRLALNRKFAPSMPVPMPANTSACSSGHVSITSGRLKRLQNVMEEHSRKHRDLHPHLGFDWSEDSAAEEDGDEVARVASYQYWRLQMRHSEDQEEGGSSRSKRLVGLASHLQQKYINLRREEKALRQHRRSQRVLRETLVEAAAQDPNQTAQLVQAKQSRASSASTCWKQQSQIDAVCSGSTKGEACQKQALPFTHHCFQHILSNGSQQLFTSCTARFADGAQCPIPVFDITHQTPLCDEHAKKMDNFLRGDVSRRMYHQHQQQQRKPLRKAKPAALTKKHKKKGKRGPKRPQKPIPPALPQGNLAMPSAALGGPSHSSGIRSPLTPDLSTDEFPDDIPNDISDISHELELNQEDFSDVLPRLPDDLQDFDLFEAAGKTSELLPTSEEADELVRVLQAMGSYPESLACLSGMADLGHSVEAVESRVLPAGVVDLLSSRLSADTFSSLELDPSLLHPTDDDDDGGFPPSPLSPQQPLTPPSSVPNSAMLPDGSLAQRQPSHLASSGGGSSSTSVSASSIGGGAVCQMDLQRLQDPSGAVGPWSSIPLSLTDGGPPFHSLVSSDTLLLSTALSTPPATLPLGVCQPATLLSALPQSSLTAAGGAPLPNPTDVLFMTCSSSSSATATSISLPQEALCSSGSLKHLSPQLLSHCGIPTDLQPHHSSPAPPMDQV